MHHLQEFIEEKTHEKGDTFKPRKSARGRQDLQILLATTYNQLAEMLAQEHMKIKLPEDVINPAEKLELITKTVEYLLSNRNQEGRGKQQSDQNSGIVCQDCKTYQSNLQKLQNEIRQHIRLQQQLKIYQESIEEKAEESKKEKKEFDKRIDGLKKHLEESRNTLAVSNDRANRLQQENEKLKTELKHLKSSLNNSSKRISKGHFGAEGKENKIDWVHRDSSKRKDEKGERKSIEKRTESVEKVTVKVPAKGITLHDKLVQEKNREERRKALHSKLQFRR